MTNYTHYNIHYGLDSGTVYPQGQSGMEQQALDSIGEFLGQNYHASQSPIYQDPRVYGVDDRGRTFDNIKKEPELLEPLDELRNKVRIWLRRK